MTSLPLCDFCCVKPPTQRLTCTDGPVIRLSTSHTPLTPAWQSVGDWAACEECLMYIKNQDDYGLARRCALSYLTTHSNTQSSIQELTLLISIGQSAFWSGWDGTVTPITAPSQAASG